MPSTIAEVDKLFAGGAETVVLTRAEGVGAAVHVHDRHRLPGLVSDDIHDRASVILEEGAWGSWLSSRPAAVPRS